MKDEKFKVSDVALALLDEYAIALEEQHYIPASATGREGTRIARRVINASRALHDYISDLEQRAFNK